MELGITKHEIENYCKSIEVHSIHDYGDKKWCDQFLCIETLGVQAALATRHGSHDHVSESLIEQSKVKALIENLIISRAWIRNVFPLVRKNLAKQASIIGYALLQYEKSILGLLQSILYKIDGIHATSETLIDIIDIITDCLICLNSLQNQNDASKEKNIVAETQDAIQKMLDVNDEEILSQYQESLRFDACWNGLSCLCHISHHVDNLSLTVIEYIINTRDLILSLVYLLQSRIWERKVGNKFECYEDGRWTEKIGDERFICGKVEAQIWMCLTNFLMNGEIQRKYGMTPHRRDTILQLLPLFDRNPNLHNQLPFLEPLHRYLIQIQLSNTCDTITESSISLVSAMPVFRNPTKINWKQVAEHQCLQFTQELNDLFAKRLSKVYNLYTLEELLTDSPHCGTCGKIAVHRCSKCRSEWYCGRKCQVKGWKAHKSICSYLSEVQEKLVDH